MIHIVYQHINSLREVLTLVIVFTFMFLIVLPPKKSQTMSWHPRNECGTADQINKVVGTLNHHEAHRTHVPHSKEPALFYVEPLP